MIQTSRCVFRLPRTRTAGCCCTRGTTITSPWSCTGAASESATTRAPTLRLLSTGACSHWPFVSVGEWLWSDSHMFSAPHSVETVNDGSFHAVELVASDQTLSLSIDGGTPKSINSISKQSTLNVDSPLYLGGEDSGPLQMD